MKRKPRPTAEDRDIAAYIAAMRPGQSGRIEIVERHIGRAVLKREGAMMWFLPDKIITIYAVQDVSEDGQLVQEALQ